MYDIDFDNAQTSFDMDVAYTNSDLITLYADRLSATLLNESSGDTTLVIESIDIIIAAGVREVIYPIGSVID